MAIFSFHLLLLLLLLLLFLCSAFTLSSSSSVGSSSSHVAYTTQDLASESRLLDLFQRWILHHSKDYSPSDPESHRRFQIFKENLFYIHNHNSRHDSPTYKLGLNKFADLTLEEFRSKYLGFGFGPGMGMGMGMGNLQKHGSDFVENGCAHLPNQVDWRLHGAVTPVKDQGQCGSCWAFSSTGAMEGAYAVATGELVSLSEQELVSCSHRNLGCHGGLMVPAFKWVMKNGGINTEDGYPYVSGDGHSKFCKWPLKRERIISIDGYKDVKPNDEEALMCAVSSQPVSVAINAGTKDFQLYADGIFSGACSDEPHDIDHAVLAVGYGSDDEGRGYWIVKNSWTEKWGKDGYVHIARGTGHLRGVCGIYATPSYPIVNKDGHSSSSVSVM